MSRVAIQGNADGAGVFTLASPNSNTDRTLDIPDADGTIDRLQRAGNILQVVQVQKTNTFTSTGTTAFVDVPGLSLSITPSSATSKILMIMTIQWGGSGYGGWRALRDGTPINVGDAEGVIPQVSGWSRITYVETQYTGGTFWLDSPNTTSPVTYSVQVGSPHTTSYDITINRGDAVTNNLLNGRTASTITLMEVAA